MNRKEIAEIRRRLNPDKNAISCVRGCYVNQKREIVAEFNRPMLSFPQEEQEKYLALFKRVLSGTPGKNSLEIGFRPDQVMEDDAHQLLMGLRNTALKVDEGAGRLCARIIESLEMEGNYLILMMHDAYDVPFRHADEHKVDVVSEEVFNYIVACVCPVKLTKPELGYDAMDNAFHTLEQDWVVAAPELGFMFPAFEDGAANIYTALYYTRDADDPHGEFIDAVFHCQAPMSAAEQRETFQAVLEDALEDDLSFDVAQTVHDKIRERIEAHAAEKNPEPLVVSAHEVAGMLSSCGVSGDRLSNFEERYDEAFGAGMEVSAANIVEPKRFEVKTPDVSIQVNPQRSDLIETRVIDGMKYIMIRADEGVLVNGVNVTIAQA